MVFDREGYSPEFFYDLWQGRIACCTYNKNVKDQWPEQEFTTYEQELGEGEKIKVELAERGTLLIGADNKKKIWCREIRKQSKSGHQTSIITTNYIMKTVLIGVYMFARWSQENFFKYMMDHFDID